MRICQRHWDRLRQALADRGLGEFGAKTGEAAVRAMVTELEGRAAENDFDPLLTCNSMIWSKGLELCGLGLMQENADGSQ